MSAILNTVYNNYLSTYKTPTSNRYDAHKKSELRSVYNSIVKLNKEAPIYLPLDGRVVKDYAISLKENARELHNTIAALGGLDEASLLSQKAASTSNEEVASATFIGTYTAGAPSPSFTLEVNSLASGQENMGNFLPEDTVSLPPDTYSFDVHINDMNYELQFTIGETETNRDVQNRLIRLINNSNIGIKADIAEAEGRSAITLSSDATGLPNGKSVIFHISDDNTSKQKGAVEYLGIDYVSHKPTNASFLVNGEERSSSSNSFTIGKMFEVRLHGTTPEEQPVTIGLKTDAESLTDNVIELAHGYNNFLTQMNNFLETHPRSKNVIREMNSITRQYGQAFADIGLTIESDGALTVDRTTLSNTIEESEDINDTFKTLKDFSQGLIRKSNQISINPMNYVEQTVVAYKNPGRNFPNPYVTSAYSGMMFNFYC